MKNCSKCGKAKNSGDFYPYKYRGMVKRMPHCKECHRAGVTRRRWRTIERLEESRKKMREYNHTSAAHKSCRKADAKRHQTEKYKLQKRTAYAVSKAIKEGVLIKPSTCSNLDCDSDRFIEAHHEDYTKPLEVDWLCSVCHKVADGRTKNTVGTTKPDA